MSDSGWGWGSGSEHTVELSNRDRRIIRAEGVEVESMGIFGAGVDRFMSGCSMILLSLFMGEDLLMEIINGRRSYLGQSLISLL